MIPADEAASLSGDATALALWAPIRRFAETLPDTHAELHAPEDFPTAPQGAHAQSQ